jgi:hypothetical protein
MTLPTLPAGMVVFAAVRPTTSPMCPGIEP